MADFQDIQQKKTFVEIRLSILNNLAKGQKTVNRLSYETGINWRTVDNHLIYLIGRGFVKEVFKSPYVKIYEISEQGKAYLEPTLLEVVP